MNAQNIYTGYLHSWFDLIDINPLYWRLGPILASGVGTQMVLKMRFGDEALATLDASEWPFSSLAEFVIPRVSLGLELFVADRALIHWRVTIQDDNMLWNVERAVSFLWLFVNCSSWSRCSSVCLLFHCTNPSGPLN